MHNNKEIFASKRKSKETFVQATIKRFIEKKLTKLSEQYSDKGYKTAIFAHDFVGNQIQLYGRFERDDLDDLFDFLAPVATQINKGVALDIGANIGNHSRCFSEKFANVIAYEPNPDVFHILEFNTRQMSNVEAYNFGIGSKADHMKLVEHAGNLGASQVTTDDGNADGFTIEIKKLDDLFQHGNKDITFVKIDVEGHELQVLQGGAKMISDLKPVIVLEQNEDEFRNNCTPSLEFLRDMGYKLCWFEYPRENMKSSVIREVTKLADRLFRNRPRICTGPKIPEKSHPMLIAVPEEMMGSLTKSFIGDP